MTKLLLLTSFIKSLKSNCTYFFPVVVLSSKDDMGQWRDKKLVSQVKNKIRTLPRCT